MRPARPWSWALLVVAAATLSGVAASDAARTPTPVFGGERHGPSLERDRLAAVDAVAVLAERSPNPADRAGPARPPLALLVVGVGCIAGLCWRGITTRVITAGARGRPPGGIGRRAPPLASI